MLEKSAVAVDMVTDYRLQDKKSKMSNGSVSKTCVGPLCDSQLIFMSYVRARLKGPEIRMNLTQRIYYCSYS